MHSSSVNTFRLLFFDIQADSSSFSAFKFSYEFYTFFHCFSVDFDNKLSVVLFQNTPGPIFLCMALIFMVYTMHSMLVDTFRLLFYS